MYRILFIDEQPADIDDFKDYVEKRSTKESFMIEAEYPLEDINEMIQLIISHHPDAIITDYMLNEYKEVIKYNVPYNGVELVKEFLSIRQDFPCFVMTSFDDDAVKSSEDVNIIYIKDILHGAEDKTQAKASFLDKVQSQIQHYKSRLQNAERELLELLALRDSGTASIEDESQIIQLDQFLEQAFNKRTSIPEEYKTLSNMAKLDDMLAKVDELLNKVDNGK